MLYSHRISVYFTSIIFFKFLNYSESGRKTEEPGNLSLVESAQVLPTDPMISDDGEATSRQWRDLVTPELPLNVPSTAGSQTSRARINVVER